MESGLDLYLNNYVIHDDVDFSIDYDDHIQTMLESRIEPPITSVHDKVDVGNDYGSRLLANRYESLEPTRNSELFMDNSVHNEKFQYGPDYDKFRTDLAARVARDPKIIDNIRDNVVMNVPMKQDQLARDRETQFNRIKKIQMKSAPRSIRSLIKPIFNVREDKTIARRAVQHSSAGGVSVIHKVRKQEGFNNPNENRYGMSKLQKAMQSQISHSYAVIGEGDHIMNRAFVESTVDVRDANLNKQRIAQMIKTGTRLHSKRGELNPEEHRLATGRAQRSLSDMTIKSNNMKHEKSDHQDTKLSNRRINTTRFSGTDVESFVIRKVKDTATKSSTRVRRNKADMLTNRKFILRTGKDNQRNMHYTPGASIVGDERLEVLRQTKMVHAKVSKNFTPTSVHVDMQHGRHSQQAAREMRTGENERRSRTPGATGVSLRGIQSISASDSANHSYVRGAPVSSGRVLRGILS